MAGDGVCIKFGLPPTAPPLAEAEATPGLPPPPPEAVAPGPKRAALLLLPWLLWLTEGDGSLGDMLTKGEEARSEIIRINNSMIMNSYANFDKEAIKLNF